MKKLTVEVNPKFTRANDAVPISKGHILLITPPLNEDYWMVRVKLSAKQAIVAFPKFGTIGCGFAQEKYSWNTNLPLGCPAATIFEHIKKNKGDKRIKDADCIRAIELLQETLKGRYNTVKM